MRKKPSRAMTEERFEAVAERFKVLGYPIRLKLLYNLGHDALSVGTLAERVDVRQPTVSKHLSILHAAGLVERNRAGTTVLYSIADPSIFELCELVCGKVEQQLAARVRALKRS